MQAEGTKPGHTAGAHCTNGSCLLPIKKLPLSSVTDSVFIAVFLLYAAQGIISCYFSGKVAKLKGYSTHTAWAVAGFFFGPIAVIESAGLPDLTARKLLLELVDRNGH